MKLIRPRLGKDLNSAVAKLVIFRGERILVDADFANRSLGRKLPSGKSININLTAVRSRGRPCERFKFLLQLVGVVGKSVEILPLDYECAGILRRTHTHGCAFFLNLNLLWFDLNLQPDVELLSLICGDHNVLFRRFCKALGNCLDRVAPGRQALELISPLAVCNGGCLLTIRSSGANSRLRDDRASWICDPAAERA